MPGPLSFGPDVAMDGNFLASSVSFGGISEGPSSVLLSRSSLSSKLKGK